jgi:hypothetical protein
MGWQEWLATLWDEQWIKECKQWAAIRQERYQRARWEHTEATLLRRETWL